MERCAIFVTVILIACTQFAAYSAKPIKIDVLNRIKRSEKSGDEFMYKFPTSIEDGFVLTINGTMNTDHKTLSVVLPSNSGGEDCRMKYNFEGGTFEITPKSSFNQDIFPYNFDRIPGKATTFKLQLTARAVPGNQRLVMILEANEDMLHGPSDEITCEINFEDIGYIALKEGVDTITSLLFKLPN